jgi:DEAD/DEAH box helicase domain-containing protein
MLWIVRQGQLWVEGIFPSQSGEHTLGSLAQQGSFDRGLMELLDRQVEPPLCPANRPLYRHQQDAILQQSRAQPSAQPAIVVTAGTGAGKTEAFLLPILNDLFRNPRQPGEEGVRTILLYPMNALVNDQLDRLDRWLQGQSSVTLLHFTSETPEDWRALKAGSLADQQISTCRLMTREQGRQNPPDILITNYSMLEYMLCRPQDAPFFGSALRSMVLDEAHLYSGTLAAEICLLLRRVLLRCGVQSQDVLQTATSATLGGGESKVKEFVAKLFSKDSGLVYFFEGNPTQRQLQSSESPTEQAANTPLNVSELEQWPFLDAENGLLIERAYTANMVRTCVRPLVSQQAIARTDSDQAPARVLYETLSRSPIVARLDAFFWANQKRKVLPLAELAEHLWADNPSLSTPTDRQQNTIALLQLCARARRHANELPIVPH